MQPMLGLALKAAEHAGNKLMRALEEASGQLPNEVIKKVEQDMEWLMAKKLADLATDYPVWGYVSGNLTPKRDSNHQGFWRVSLEGLGNLSQQLPMVSLQLIFEHNDQCEHALIYHPQSRDVWSASQGRAAEYNHRRIRCAEKIKLNDAVIGLEAASTRAGKALTQRAIEQLSQTPDQLRLLGNPALTGALLAAGGLDVALLETDNPVTLQAVLLLAKVSGALYGNLEGDSRVDRLGTLVLANAKLFKATLQALNN